MVAETLKKREIEEKAVNTLLEIARPKIAAGRRSLGYIAGGVHVEKTYNPELVHKSFIKWEYDQPLTIEVYYTNLFEEAVVLAHEVGHLETLPALGGPEYYRKGGQNVYNAEYAASAWALDFLADCGASKELLKDAQRFLQSCLDNYQAGLRYIPARRVLPVPVAREDRISKVQGAFNF